MKQKLYSAALAVLLALCCVLPAAAESMEYVFDDVDLLDNAGELEDFAEQAYSLVGLGIYVAAMDCTDLALLDAAQEVWERTPQYDDSVLLMIDPVNSRFNIYASGEMTELLQQRDNGCYDQLCKVYDEAPTYEGGAMDFMETAFSVWGQEKGLLVSDASPNDRSGDQTVQDGQGDTIPDELPAETYRLVVDDAGVLSRTELAELNDYAESICAQYPYDIVLYFADTLGGKSAQAAADDYFDYNGYGVGENYDGMILLVCPSSRDYAFSGCGAGIPMFDSDRLNRLESDAVDYLRDNDWFGAGMIYLQDCERYLSAGMPVPPPKQIPFLWLPIDLMIAFVLAFIPGMIEKGKLKSVAQRSGAVEYVPETGVNIRHSSRRLVNVLVHRSPLPQQTSSSGSGIHVSSSGRSHSGRSGKF